MPPDCFICSTILAADDGRSPWFVARLRTGYVVLNEVGQYHEGYTLFLCKECVPELHHLRPRLRVEFLREMALVAEAVFRAFGPAKLNYELLGNTVPHLHWHIVPRYRNDPKPLVPIWENQEFVDSQRTGPRPGGRRLDELKRRLLRELEQVAAARIRMSFAGG